MNRVREPTAEDRERVRRRPVAATVMYQRWRDLLFLHWDWDAEEIQRTLPQGLYVDRHDRRAWLGVVPFKMRDVRPRFVPALPWISDFLELNLRTYVHDAAGLPGVWFYSLDANRWLAAAVARRFFGLPYHRATMHAATADADLTVYSSARGAQRDRYRYRPVGPARRAQAGSLEYFLLERYVLFAATRAGLRAGRVHHAPYPLRDVERLEWSEGLFRLNGFAPPRRAPDHAVASAGVDVSVHALERI